MDRGYRGIREIGETEILVPGPKPKEQSPDHTRLMRQRFRCAIEPLIGHLKVTTVWPATISRALPVTPATSSWPLPPGTSRSGSPGRLVYLNLLRWLLSAIDYTSLRPSPF